VAKKKKTTKINLKLYRPDVNESMMLIEALEKAAHKTIHSSSTTPGLPITARIAKNFIQNAYIIADTYSPEIIESSIIKVIESDIQHLSKKDLNQAYTGLKDQLTSIKDALGEICSQLTTMYRSVPIHYRVGYVFRDASAKKTKAKLGSLQKKISEILILLDNSYQ
jgi:2-phospho-L-lactate guanylyltransferase (CobY/MobA/RfbA family)